MGPAGGVGLQWGRGIPLHLGFSPGSCRSETLGARRVGVVQLEVGWLWMGCGRLAGLVRLVCGCVGDTSWAPEPLPWPGRSWGCLQASGRNVTAAFCSPHMGGEQAGPGPQPRVPAAAPCVGLRGAGWAAAWGRVGCGTGLRGPQCRTPHQQAHGGCPPPGAVRCRLSLISIPAV